MFFTAKAATEQKNLYSALAVCQTLAMLSQPLLLPPEQPGNKLRGKHLWPGHLRRKMEETGFGGSLSDTEASVKEEMVPLGWLESRWLPAHFIPLRTGVLCSNSEERLRWVTDFQGECWAPPASSGLELAAGNDKLYLSNGSTLPRVQRFLAVLGNKDIETTRQWLSVGTVAGPHWTRAQIQQN